MTKPSPQMTLIEHLVELRSRLIKSVITMGIMALGSLAYSKEIYALLQRPMLQVLSPSSSFIATTPFESYTTYFKVALIAGVFLSSPFLFYHLWQFLAPGLAPKERKYLLPFSLASGLLFFAGAFFGYFFVFPLGFYYVNVLLDGTAIQFMPRMSDYFNVATTLLFSFGITFELPLVIILLGKLGLIEYAHIRRFRRYVIVGLFILAAMLTPGPDILSQCLLALPLWFLYEMGGLALRLMKR